ncbi:MAG TPA: hypothetical protein VGR78_00310 [Verrucomicrobiae bacterium]|nr:hypothetical protein [Verrucomicrobiae bacterium]
MTTKTYTQEILKMKKRILFIWIGALALGFDGSGYGQGTIVFNNLGAPDGKVYLSTGGAGGLLDQDINFLLRIDGPGNLPVLDRSWLLSDGTARGINVGPGLFADPTHSVIVLPGIAPGEPITVFIDAWVGNYPTLGAALQAGAAWGEGAFSSSAGSIEAPPATLVDMRSPFTVASVPEPATVSVALLGTVLLFLNRIRDRSKRSMA